MNADQVRMLVVRPALERLAALTTCRYTQAAENLLMGTAATESNMGRYIRQYPTGPACGIFQIEPATAESIMENYVRYRPEFKAAVDYLSTGEPLAQQLVTNLSLQVIIARLVYYPKTQPLPDATDLHGLGAYWKKHFNTDKGKGTAQKFVDDYARYVL